MNFLSIITCCPLVLSCRDFPALFLPEQAPCFPEMWSLLLKMLMVVVTFQTPVT